MTVAEMTRLYNSGLSMGQIAERAGVKLITVSKYLKRAGVKLRNPGQSRQLARAQGRSWKGIHFHVA